MATYEISPEMNAIVKGYAEQRGITPTEALSRMVKTAHGRAVTVAKYDGRKPPRKVAAARGPLARKIKRAPARKSPSVPVRVIVKTAE
jgi:hypothetical protein